MTILVFSALLLLISFFAGFLGALTGLGGGVVIIPVLVLLFHINIHYAMGASLISVIATSSGTAAAYLREGYTNLRIGMFLESSAVVGAFAGAMLISMVSKSLLAFLFSLLLFFSAWLTFTRKENHEKFQTSHPMAISLKLNQNYHVQNVPLALGMMGFAGLMSGLLGIGSGVFKVLAMDQAMRLPYKVSTTTSNFMIGITAAVSVGIYFTQGYINPVIVFPVLLGVICGAMTGARILPRMHTRFLRIIFSLVICIMGVQMFYKALTGA